jgi:hypothetical protein
MSLVIPGPVGFRRDVRVTIQQIGSLADHRRGGITRTGRRWIRAGEGPVETTAATDGKLERSDDRSNVARYDPSRPENGRAPWAPRVAGL